MERVIMIPLMSYIAAFPLAVFLAFIIIGGPLTLIIGIKVFNIWFGNIWVKPVATGLAKDENASLGLQVSWDSDTHSYKVCRVRLEYYEIIPGGRAETFSFTFEDKSARKRSFVLPLKLSKEQLQILVQAPTSSRDLKRCYAIAEVESTDGRTIRRKISKAKLLEALQSLPVNAEKEEVDILPAKEVDSWSVISRIFPWRVASEVVAETGKKAAKPAAGGSAVAQIFDFIITKVWIEPGCIVCDACENEAPDVFQVLADTCIVRENAPLVNTGSIVAATEGCPVDVIKYSTAPKSA